MLTIGTHNDFVASHYVLVDPEMPGGVDDDDVPLLDPIQPLKPHKRRWTLTDSYKYLSQNVAIGREWQRAKIHPRQISGAWAFGRWRTRSQHSLAATLFRTVVQEAAILETL